MTSGLCNQLLHPPESREGGGGLHSIQEGRIRSWVNVRHQERLGAEQRKDGHAAHPGGGEEGGTWWHHDRGTRGSCGQSQQTANQTSAWCCGSAHRVLGPSPSQPPFPAHRPISQMTKLSPREDTRLFTLILLLKLGSQGTSQVLGACRRPGWGGSLLHPEALENILRCREIQTGLPANQGAV